jgi:hypothetical protein
MIEYCYIMCHKHSDYLFLLRGERRNPTSSFSLSTTVNATVFFGVVIFEGEREEICLDRGRGDSGNNSDLDREPDDFFAFISPCTLPGYGITKHLIPKCSQNCSITFRAHKTYSTDSTASVV